MYAGVWRLGGHLRSGAVSIGHRNASSLGHDSGTLLEAAMDDTRGVTSGAVPPNRPGVGPARRLPAAERAMLLQRLRAGDTHAEAAAHVGCSAKTVQRLLPQTGGVPRRITTAYPLRLSLAERDHLLSFGLVQEVAHGGKRPSRNALPGYASARLWWPVFRCPLVAGLRCSPTNQYVQFAGQGAYGIHVGRHEKLTPWRHEELTPPPLNPQPEVPS